MAIYKFQTGTHSRSKGHSAVAAAAYRSGEKLYDERTGETYDYRKYRTEQGGCAFSAIFLPDDTPEEYLDRGTLWNGLEGAEKTKAGAYKKSAAIARENMGALPHELTLEQQIELVRDYANWRVKRYGTAVDASIHPPDKDGDKRNWHVHFFESTRTFDADGIGGKSELELSGRKKKELGFKTGPQQVEEMRKSWADHVNLHLEKAGLAIRVDHRSYKDQGIEKKPGVHMGVKATAMERKAHKNLKELQQTAKIIDFEIEKEKRRLSAEQNKLAEAKKQAAENTRQQKEQDNRAAFQARRERDLIAAIEKARAAHAAADTFLNRWVFKGNLKSAADEVQRAEKALEGFKAQTHQNDNAGVGFQGVERRAPQGRSQNQHEPPPVAKQFAENGGVGAAAKIPEKRYGSFSDYAADAKNSDRMRQSEPPEQSEEQKQHHGPRQGLN